MEFWKRVESVSQERSVLRHPFYVRWSKGSLSVDELAAYSGQYRHVVVALADAIAWAALSPEAGSDAAKLATHAEEEWEHIGLWDEFIAAVGGNTDAAVNPETRACASVWAGDESRPLDHTLTALYAIESAQPVISQTKQEGLIRHYGIPGSPYFELHAERDVEHAEEVRVMLDRRLADADQDALLATAEEVLEANWLLLDGIEAAGQPDAVGSPSLT